MPILLTATGFSTKAVARNLQLFRLKDGEYCLLPYR